MVFTDNKWWYTYIQIYRHTAIISQPFPLPLTLPSSRFNLYNSIPLFTYLENQLLLLVVWIPIFSCPWLAINYSPLAASPTPRHPIDQFTYLHRHQQHQPSRLIQCWYSKFKFKFRQCPYRPKFAFDECFVCASWYSTLCIFHVILLKVFCVRHSVHRNRSLYPSVHDYSQ